jgi:hypothetical protein
MPPTTVDIEERLAETLRAIQVVARELVEAEELMAIVLRKMRIVAERAAHERDPSFVVHEKEEA